MLTSRRAILSGLVLLTGLGQAHALTMAECAAKFNAAKEAGTLTQTWRVFQKAECGPGSKPMASKAVPQAEIEQASQMLGIVLVGEKICQDFNQDQIAFVHNSAMANLASVSGKSIYEIRAKLGELEGQVQSTVSGLTGDKLWQAQEKICPFLAAMLPRG